VALGVVADSARAHVAGHRGRQQQRLGEATTAQLDEHVKWLGETRLASGA
jgi:hypothetical protein